MYLFIIATYRGFALQTLLTIETKLNKIGLQQNKFGVTCQNCRGKIYTIKKVFLTVMTYVYDLLLLSLLLCKFNAMLEIVLVSLLLSFISSTTTTTTTVRAALS